MHQGVIVWALYRQGVKMWNSLSEMHPEDYLAFLYLMGLDRPVDTEKMATPEEIAAREVELYRRLMPH